MWGYEVAPHLEPTLSVLDVVANDQHDQQVEAPHQQIPAPHEHKLGASTTHVCFKSHTSMPQQAQL